MKHNTLMKCHITIIKTKLENLPFYLDLILQVKIHKATSQTREIELDKKIQNITEDSVSITLTIRIDVNVNK